MKNKIAGVLLFITALVFQRMQTEHFGNNLFPKTFLEFLCDLVSVVIIYFAFLTFNKSKRIKTLHRFLLYFITILYIPFTIIRLLIAVVIKADLWCDKVIDKIISDVNE